MSKSVSNNFHCEHCDINVQSKEDFERHCKGRKHLSNQHLAKEQEAAKRTVYVRGIQGIPEPEKYLLSCFSCFGKVNKVTVRGKKNGGNYAFVELQDRETVAKVVQKKKHYFKECTLFVSQYHYRPPKWEMYRMLHKQTEVEEKEKLTQIHKDEIAVLISAESLYEQIHLLAERLRLTPEDEKARVGICEDLTNIFGPYFEDCAVYQFGSSINRFGAKGCDLDLFLDLQQSSFEEGVKVKKPKIVLPHHKDMKSIKSLKTDFGPLTAEQLGKIDLFDKVKLVAGILTSKSNNYSDTMTIPSQRCPVVKFSHKPTGIKCDLSLNNRKALHNSLLLRLYGCDPRVHKLVSVVRLWARSHELAGGVGANQLLTNYALTLIVMFFLMSRKPRIIPLVCNIENCVEGVKKEVVDDWECIVIPPDAVLPPSDNTETEVELLKAFFQFYASCVDWDKDVLLTKNGTFFPKGQVSQDPAYIGCKTSFMTVLDPFVLTHNVTGNVNEKTRDKFIAEVKRAVKLTNDWPHCDPGSASEHWGIAALLMPDPNEDSPTKSSKKASRKGEGNTETKEISRVEGQLDNGEFCIAIQPTASVMTRSDLLAGAAQNKVTPSQQWCSLAQDMVLGVLETVFKAEIKEGGEEEEETEGQHGVKVDERKEKNDMEVDEDDLGTEQSKSEADIPVSSQNDIDSDVKGQKGDNRDSQCDKARVEEGVTEPVSGKRTRQEAHLDVSSDEMINTALVDAERESFVDQSPGKKICDRVMRTELTLDSPASLATDASNSKTDDHSHKLNTENNIPNEDKELSGSGVELVQGSDREQKSSDPVSSDIQTETIEAGNSPKYFYTCVCEHWLWMGRKKLRQRLHHSTLDGLALEQEISRLAVGDIEKKAREDQAKSNPPVGSTSQTSGGKKPKEKEDLTIRFMCSFQHRSLDAQIPHILVKMKPNQNCANHFKNLFCSFRSLVLRLVTSHLFDT